MNAWELAGVLSAHLFSNVIWQPNAQRLVWGSSLKSTEVRK